MDHATFDRLARRFATPSRRSLLRAFAVALGAGTIAQAEPAAAGCRKVGENCRRNGQCCDDARCRRGRCKCKRGFTECDGRCRDLDTDENNCGRCGRKCRNNETCVKEGGGDARCRRKDDDDDGRCAGPGQRCDRRRDCCPGLACRAGNAAFRACVVVS